MGTIKIILKEDVSNLGEAGDIKLVKKGYARNFLFPKNLVMDYSKENRKLLEDQKEHYEKRKLEKRENADKLKEKLEQEKISVTISSGDKGRLFGTVTNVMIAEKLSELNYNLEKKQIELKEHIKFSGNYKVKIHLYQDIYAEIDLEVIGKVEKAKQAKKPQRKPRRRYFDEDDQYQDNDNMSPDNNAEEQNEIKEEAKEDKQEEVKETETQE